MLVESVLVQAMHIFVSITCMYVYVFINVYACLGCPCSDHTARLPTPVLVWRHVLLFKDTHTVTSDLARVIVTRRFSHHTHPPQCRTWALRKTTSPKSVGKAVVATET